MNRNLLIVTMTLPAIASAAVAASLPLRAGTYVSTDQDCSNPAFAGTFDYNAGAFSYPHESGCTDSVVRRSAAGHYTLRETCRALGDGTPAKPTTQTIRVHLLSSERVEMTFAGQRPRTYRLCTTPRP